MIESPSLEHWRAEAEAVTAPRRLPMPMRVLLEECVASAIFVDEYFHPAGTRPGLSSAGPRLPRSIADDILSVRVAIQDAETAYLRVLDPSVNLEVLKRRATELLVEITAVLEWHLDDGTEVEAELMLAHLDVIRDDVGGADSLAQALHDYTALAKPMADQLAGLGGFDVACLDEAAALADALSRTTAPRGHSQGARAARLLRNQLAHLLYERVSTVRAAARFVFRHHPEICRIALAGFAPRRHAEARRAQHRAVSEITASSDGEPTEVHDMGSRE